MHRAVSLLLTAKASRLDGEYENPVSAQPFLIDLGAWRAGATFSYGSPLFHLKRAFVFDFFNDQRASVNFSIWIYFKLPFRYSPSFRLRMPCIAEHIANGGNEVTIDVVLV